ncbi:MAG: histidine kinase [Bradyrhizobium sp.]|nr:histidine kinase [Bradyrhizobium sp.]
MRPLSFRISSIATGYGFRFASLRFPKAPAVEFFTPLPHGSAASSLGMALVFSSATPLLLLDANLIVKAASGSFCSAFDVDCDSIVGLELSALGDGEWAIPQLRSLLRATVSGDAAIKAYELDLVRLGRPMRTLVVNAHKLDYLRADLRSRRRARSAPRPRPRSPRRYARIARTAFGPASPPSIHRLRSPPRGCPG